MLASGLWVPAPALLLFRCSGGFFGLGFCGGLVARFFVSLIVAFIALVRFGCGFNFDFGFVGQTVGAGGDDGVAGTDALDDLGIGNAAQADLYGSLVSEAVLACDQNKGAGVA